jgi:hypothetical protein
MVILPVTVEALWNRPANQPETALTAKKLGRRVIFLAMPSFRST